MIKWIYKKEVGNYGFLVRNLGKDELDKLDRLARRNRVSREEYVRRIIRLHLLQPEANNIEEKYQNLVSLMTDVVQNNTERLEEVLETVKELNDRGEKDVPDYRSEYRTY